MGGERKRIGNSIDDEADDGVSRRERAVEITYTEP